MNLRGSEKKKKKSNVTYSLAQQIERRACERVDLHLLLTKLHMTVREIVFKKLHIV